MDRLSELPDSILCHILSFLPTKTSVATSILAKRFRFLWAYIPNLYFTDTDFSHHKNLRIIDRVLLLHQLPNLRSLRINLLDQDEKYCDEFQIETWILAAIDRNVEFLRLLVPSSKSLPLRLFNCKTLVGFRLYFCGEIPTLENVCLPFLKKLDLQLVAFEDDKSLPCLLFGSSILQYLRIRCGDETPNKSSHITSPTLKWLCLDDLICTEEQLEINTPSLEYLSAHFTVSSIKSGDQTSLVRADIYDYEESEDLLNFLDMLCNVKCLNLYLESTNTPEIVDGLLSRWTPIFKNLTQLNLTSDSEILSSFLQSANNLEILEFRAAPDASVPSHEVLNKLTKRPQVPDCLISSLTIITIYVEEEDDLKIIRCLMRSAQVLKRMVIAYHPRLEHITPHLHQKTSQFERGCKTCELAESVYHTSTSVEVARHVQHCSVVAF